MVRIHEVNARKFGGGRFSREMEREQIHDISFHGFMVSCI
jgi:hypothetical protein